VPAVACRRRWKTVCAGGACQTAVAGRSASPLDVVVSSVPPFRTSSRTVAAIQERIWKRFAVSDEGTDRWESLLRNSRLA
jgi:hypothetical protein